jgi:4-hydroxy-tetrahydrodipicolinate reductase
MKIALIGYGKMGKSIDELAQKRGHEIVARVGNSAFTSQEIANADVAIEFSQPSAAVENIYKCFEADVPVVVGTTGWYNQFPNIKAEALNNNKAIFTATNFSIGVNLFFNLNKKLAKMMNGFEDYDVKMNETHHIHKKDHPSGTASTLAEGIIDNLDRKNNYVGQLDTQNMSFEPFDLQIDCKREGEVFGFHEVVYTSPIDEIKISHNALSREGFALGAIVAAEWLKNKKGVFTMNDLLKFD